MKQNIAKFIKKLRSLSFIQILVLTACCALVCYAGWRSTTRIIDSNVPLTSGISMKTGDIVTVKVYAKQASDLYGYQFQLNFDEGVLEYKNLRSSIPEISMIFQKPFTGYILVGATKIGDEPGYSGDDALVCEIELRAKKDGVTPQISISDVNVVNSILEYTEDVLDWSLELVL